MKKRLLHRLLSVCNSPFLYFSSLSSSSYTPLDLFVEIAVHLDVTLDYLILGKVETKKELELSKKIHDQKQIIESFGKQLLAFAAMEIEAESA
ncbi:hypothetical protein [Faecalibacterium wellingii]|uniref:XRE family transcriptional regulator n=1 Tax=Faecalibacterium wellingii TaxID=2929491 RepID=A0ABU3TZW4_9FIRM|nr:MULTISPECIES: hypothetical protein [Faecalibacterium]MDU8688859.1 hypothetical protein [Faecalibacterium prausnitzii]UQK56628.1 hypothetical protein MTP37_00515 [Faecalibacterium sp. HTF-F]